MTETPTQDQSSSDENLEYADVSASSPSDAINGEKPAVSRPHQMPNIPVSEDVTRPIHLSDAEIAHAQGGPASVRSKMRNLPNPDPRMQETQKIDMSKVRSRARKRPAFTQEQDHTQRPASQAQRMPRPQQMRPSNRGAQYSQQTHPSTRPAQRAPQQIRPGSQNNQQQRMRSGNQISGVQGGRLPRQMQPHSNPALRQRDAAVAAQDPRAARIPQQGQRPMRSQDQRSVQVHHPVRPQQDPQNVQTQRPRRPQQDPRTVQTQRTASRPAARVTPPAPHPTQAPRKQIPRPQQQAPQPQPQFKPQQQAQGTPAVPAFTSMPEADTAPLSHLTPRLALELAAPQTWPAAILPVMLATTTAAAWGIHIAPLMTLALLIICVLMQSAVNTINDYFDYIHGEDNEENQVDPHDAVLVYNNINPTHARNLAIAFMATAFLIGIYPIYTAGAIPLIIALIGALVVWLYSGGKTPISSLPIGEAVSGIVMGGLIPLACMFVYAHELSLAMFAISIPVIIGIGLIMMTNNISDIEKDIEANRKTLCALLGREKAKRVYDILIYTWVAFIIVIVAIGFTQGLIIVVFMLFAMHPFGRALISNPRVLATRSKSMGQIQTLNVGFGAFYCAAILFGALAPLA